MAKYHTLPRDHKTVHNFGPYISLYVLIICTSPLCRRLLLHHTWKMVMRQYHRMYTFVWVICHSQILLLVSFWYMPINCSVSTDILWFYITVMSMINWFRFTFSTGVSTWHMGCVVCDTGLTRRLAYVFIGAPIHARKTHQNGENAKQQCAVKLEQSK